MRFYEKVAELAERMPYCASPEEIDCATATQEHFIDLLRKLTMRTMYVHRWTQE